MILTAVYSPKWIKPTKRKMSFRIIPPIKNYCGTI